MIKQREQAKILERHHPNLASRIKSLFPNKSQNGVESALYRMGRGEKSIFWYWEINYKLRYYRDFRAIDLSKGEKIFRGEDFDLWPDDFDSGSEEGDEDGEHNTSQDRDKGKGDSGCEGRDENGHEGGQASRYESS
jgi:hypothetical protein